MKYLILLLLLVGCTDATRARGMSIGTSEVTCYSAGALIYKGKSTGRVERGDSGSWFFKEESTGDAVSINADCIVRN